MLWVFRFYCNMVKPKMIGLKLVIKKYDAPKAPCTCSRFWPTLTNYQSVTHAVGANRSRFERRANQVGSV